MLQDMERIILLFHVHAGEAAPGAAHGVEAPSADLPEPVEPAKLLVDHRGDALAVDAHGCLVVTLRTQGQ